MQQFLTTTLAVAVVLGIPALAQPENKRAANPENVMVDRFTFARPTQWNWEPNTQNSDYIARFRVPNNQGGSTTDVRFYIFTEDSEKTKSVWESSFVGDSKLQIEKQDEAIGKYHVTWLSLTGTRKGLTKELPHCKFVGVIIPIEERHVAVRLFGPQTRVDAATNDFRKMIHQALVEP